MNILEHNRIAWNEEVAKGNQWTIPVTAKEIEAASRGDYQLLLTPKIPVPQEWLGDVAGKEILCLASGGGQQGPILAAAGAQVTVFDNSDAQLKRDRRVAQEFELRITTVRGNMQDLNCFADATFDLILHPVSNCFIDEIRSVWWECNRVLKVQGRLLSGFANPVTYMIDWEIADNEQRCEIAYSIPYSDVESLPEKEKQKYISNAIPFEFGHSLTDQIQGQIEAGFVIAGFYEDKGDEILDQFIDRFIATKAIKLE